MTWLIIEDFMEEVSFKLGQGLDFTVGDSHRVGKGIQVQQNDLSRNTVTGNPKYVLRRVCGLIWPKYCICYRMSMQKQGDGKRKNLEYLTKEFGLP